MTDYRFVPSWRQVPVDIDSRSLLLLTTKDSWSRQPAVLLLCQSCLRPSIAWPRQPAQLLPCLVWS